MIDDLTLKEYRIQVGWHIRYLREYSGWTVEQVAEMAGVKPKTIEKIEAGAFNVSFDILAKVSNVLDARVTIELNEDKKL